MGMFLELVFPQHFPREVARATYLTDVIPLSSVYLHMIFVFPAHPLGEVLTTVLTLVHHVLLLGMNNTFVPAQGRAAAEAASTLTTLERFLTSVNCHVVTQATTVSKLGRTELAGKPFMIGVMASFVSV